MLGVFQVPNVTTLSFRSGSDKETDILPLRVCSKVEGLWVFFAPTLCFPDIRVSYPILLKALKSEVG